MFHFILCVHLCTVAHVAWQKVWY